MIEKLKRYVTGGENMVAISCPPEPQDIMDKINEIIELLNKIVVDVDPYAEQRKWIGKACWFWDGNAQTKAFGQLKQIDPLDDGQNAPYQTNYGQWYEHCEPANDDIIYKGE